MKKNVSFHPFLFSIYPIIALYSRLPGALAPVTLLRPLAIAVVIPLLILSLGRLRRKDIQKIAATTSFAVIVFSTSGHTYRLISRQFWASAPNTLHVGIVIFLIIALILISTPRVWGMITSVISPEKLTKFLNIVSIVAVSFPMIMISKFWIENKGNQNESWSALIGKNDSKQQISYKNLPDIYYIVLDGYARADVLKSVYGYSNNKFTEYLEGKGFFLAKESRSNYIQTFLSLGSSLNYEYVNFIETKAGADSIYTYPFMNLIHNSRSRAFLEDLGYQIVALGSDFPFTEIKSADIFLSPFPSNISELERYYLSTTSFEILFEMDYFLKDSITKAIPIPSYTTRQNYIQYSLDNLKKIPVLTSPKFVFSHIIVPHPPFIFDKNGNRITPEGSFSPADGEAYQGSSDEYQSLYVAQLEFVNREIESVIETILSNSPETPIIIIQGDHGPGSLFNRDWLEGSCLFERISILNAYLFPGGKGDILYDSVTPVNTFRLIFNGYFGTDFAILEDKSYFSPISRPYEFVDITNQIEPNCE